MQFFDLLLKVNIEDIIQYINDKYGDNTDEEYREMYSALINRGKQEISEKNLKLYVIPQLSYFSKENEDEEQLDVLGYSEEDDTDYALDLTSWNEWLSLIVVENSVELIGLVPFVAECLREMSFISFNEETIEDFRQSLMDTADRIEKGEEKLYTSEEVFADLREKFGGEPFVDNRSEAEKEKDVIEIKRKSEINMNRRKEILGL